MAGLLFIGSPLLFVDYSSPNVWSIVGGHVGATLINVLVFAAIGTAIVLALKRPGGRERELDREMAPIRAEIAARETPPPQGH